MLLEVKQLPYYFMHGYIIFLALFPINFNNNTDEPKIAFVPAILCIIFLALFPITQMILSLWPQLWWSGAMLSMADDSF